MNKYMEHTVQVLHTSKPVQLRENTHPEQLPLASSDLEYSTDLWDQLRVSMHLCSIPQHLQHYSASLREIRNSRHEPEAETMEGHCILAWP